MVEYTEREGMQIKLEATGHQINLGNTYFDKYNFVVDAYNSFCERPCEKLEHLPANCCREATYHDHSSTICSGIGMVIIAIVVPGLAFLMNLIIWLTSLSAIRTYERNDKKAQNILRKFIYCPELCRGMANAFYDLSIKCYKAGILSFNGQNMHVDASHIKVTGDKISFMVYNETFSDYITDTELIYEFYKADLVISAIELVVVICLVLYQVGVNLHWYSN